MQTFMPNVHPSIPLAGAVHGGHVWELNLPGGVTRSEAVPIKPARPGPYIFLLPNR
jgi:hypothetical protein